MTITRYRKKPVEIEAVQWDGTADGATRIIDWILNGGATATYACSNPDRCATNDGDTPHSIEIRTLEGTMRADLDDWIIRGVQGEFYPCKPDIFAATYELAEAGSAATEATEPESSARELIAAAIYEHNNPGRPWADAHPDDRITYGGDADAALTVIQPGTRITATLARMSEADVQRVVFLYGRWVKAGPPPLGTLVSRWWDARLVELHNAIMPPADATTEK